MPQLIKHIDKIAREKNRAVVFVSFEPKDHDVKYNYTPPNHLYSDWEQDTNRQELIAWLDANLIAHEDAAIVASECGFMAYGGNLYIDVPFDPADPNYQLVSQRLENPDGTMRNPQVKFWFLPLEQAMENAHHDEPGFWEKWAETF